MDRLIPPIEQDRSRHSVCKLKAALRLIAGRDVRVPGRAYSPSPSRLARELQMGNSIYSLLFSIGSHRTLVSGQGLAYVSGELEYFTDRVLSRALHFFSKKQPFFVLSGTDAAASIASLTGCDALPAPKLRLSTQCVVVITANCNGVPAVLHFGACDEARAAVLRQKRGLEIASSDPRIQQLAPRLISHFTGANGAEVLVETKLAGAPLEFNWRRVDAIRELWLAGKPAVATHGRPRLCQELTEVCDSLPSYRDSLCPAMDSLLEWHST
jgi:hypothetical protein